MKMYLIFMFVLKILLRVDALCCFRKLLYWDASNCEPFHTSWLPKRCYAKVCADGREHGFYCGVGNCNIFGCNCDKGCIKGNAMNNFKLRSGIKKFKEGVDYGDFTTWKFK